MKAKELAAPYLLNVEVTIHLFKGAHYAVENRFDALNIFMEKEAMDTHALNLVITIKPLRCGFTKERVEIENDHCVIDDSTVTIYNKIRERF